MRVSDKTEEEIKKCGSTSGSASNGSGAACAFAFSAMFEQEKITEDDS